MPEDIENLAQASKHIESVSGPALEVHRRLDWKHTSCRGLAAAETVEPLLKDVLANPRIGHYVKRIELCRDPWVVRNIKMRVRKRVKKVVSNRVKQIMSKRIGWKTKV